jgi:predicted SprT family Zn-dependent metalloprotease
VNARIRLLAPRRKGKKKSTSTELELLAAYKRALARHEVSPELIVSLDLDNDFFWLFRLSELIAKGYEKFDEINDRYFAAKYARPQILFCTRATGGYYHKGRHEIGISLAMTVECGEAEFMETLLHEIAHIAHMAHSPKFYELLTRIGGSGRKAPMTLLLAAKRVTYRERNYPVVVLCPNCKREHRYKTRRALKYACRPCCNKFAGGKFDARFKFMLSEPGLR